VIRAAAHRSHARASGEDFEDPRRMLRACRTEDTGKLLESLGHRVEISHPDAFDEPYALVHRRAA